MADPSVRGPHWIGLKNVYMGPSVRVSHSQDRYGNNMTCANNCRGVNPNAVIIGGTAVLVAAAVTPLQVLAPLGLGALAAAGVGQMMNRRSCPATRPCRVDTFPDDLHTTSQMVKLKTVAFFQARDRGNPRRRKCCRPFGAGQGTVRCPRVC